MFRARRHFWEDGGKKKEEQKRARATIGRARVLARNPAADPVYSVTAEWQKKKKTRLVL